MPWCFKRVFIILIVVIIIIIIIIIILCYYRAFKKLWSKKSKTLHETKKCCELIRSVIRRKIWEGRYEFGTEEQRTSGEREYVVGRQLWAFTPQVFRRRQISELFLSHVRIIHISIQVLIQTWTKKNSSNKKIGFLPCRLQERLFAEGWHTAINQIRRAQSGLARLWSAFMKILTAL